MMGLLFYPVFPCEDPLSAEECLDYRAAASNEMEDDTMTVFIHWIGIIFVILIGNLSLFIGFGYASERINKRVRDRAFESLVRQEMGYFDMRPIGILTTKLQNDATAVHTFSGDPVRNLFVSISSIAVGLVFSFVYMWPLALVILAILPFMAFGAQMEMKMYMGDDEGDAKDHDNTDSEAGTILVESLLNMRLVASLCLEKQVLFKFITHNSPTIMHWYENPNLKRGMFAGLGQFFQNWGIALMFYWGGYIMLNYPTRYDFYDFNVSLWAILFGLSGLSMATQGAASAKEVQASLFRIFDLIDRKSSIDPLANNDVDERRGKEKNDDCV